MADERTYDITFRAKANTQDAKSRLEELRKEIKDLQNTKPFSAGLYTNERGNTDYREAWSAQMANKLKEATELERQLGKATPKTPPASPVPSQAAKAAATAAHAAEATPQALALRDTLANAASAARAAGMTQAAERASALAGALGRIPPASALAVVGVGALAVGIGIAIKTLADGARQAADLAKELDGLSGADRELKARELGQLGEVLERNSATLLNYGEHLDKASRKGSDFITAFGAGFAPVLDEVAKAIDSLNMAALGEKFGNLAAAITQATVPLVGFLELYNRLPGGVQQQLQQVGMFAVSPALGIANLVADQLPQQDQAEATEELRARNARNWTRDLDLRRRDEMEGAAPRLPGSQEDPVALRRMFTQRRDELVDMVRSGTARDGESLLSFGDAKNAMKRILDFDKQITALNQRIEKANAEAENSTALNEAKARGDASEVSRLEWMRIYRGLIAKGVDDSQGLATRATNAEFAAKETERRPVELSDAAVRGGSPLEAMMAAAEALSGRESETIRLLSRQATAAESANTKLDAIQSSINDIPDFLYLKVR